MPRNRDEARLQETIVAWCRNRGLRPTHVENEGKRNAVQMACAKRMGMVPGVPDLLILERCPAEPGIRGVALEIKTPKGRVSPRQAEWMALMGTHGWSCHVVRSKQEAIDILTKLGF